MPADITVVGIDVKAPIQDRVATMIKMLQQGSPYTVACNACHIPKPVRDAFHAQAIVVGRGRHAVYSTWTDPKVVAHMKEIAMNPGAYRVRQEPPARKRAAAPTKIRRMKKKVYEGKNETQILRDVLSGVSELERRLAEKNAKITTLTEAVQKRELAGQLQTALEKNGLSVVSKK